MTSDEGFSVSVLDRLEPIATEWDELAIRSSAPPFARPGWTRAWWSAFGRGKLQLLVAKRGGKLAAVLPLHRHRGRLVSCSNVHTPVFDCAASSTEAVVALLKAALQAPAGIRFFECISDGRLATALRDESIKAEAWLYVQRTTAAPRRATSMNRADLERSLGRSKGAEVRRRMRRLSELDGGFSLKLGSFAPRFDDDLQDFFRIEASGWKGKGGTAISASETTERFYTDVATWAAENDQLELLLLKTGRQTIAASLAIADATHYYALKIGYDEQFRRYSPGVLLTLDRISKALVHGKSFEFGGGDSELKSSLADGMHTLEDLALFPRTPRGLMSAAGTTALSTAKRAARGSDFLRAGRNRTRRLLTSMRRHTGR